MEAQGGLRRAVLGSDLGGLLLVHPRCAQAGRSQAGQVAGIGFDATCSLVAVDAEGNTAADIVRVEVLDSAEEIVAVGDSVETNRVETETTPEELEPPREDLEEGGLELGVWPDYVLELGAVVSTQVLDELVLVGDAAGRAGGGKRRARRGPQSHGVSISPDESGVATTLHHALDPCPSRRIDRNRSRSPNPVTPSSLRWHGPRALALSTHLLLAVHKQVDGRGEFALRPRSARQSHDRSSTADPS